MPSDASIYSLIRPVVPPGNPLEQYGQAMQIRNLMGQGELQGLQTQKIRQGMEEEKKLRELFTQGTPTTEQVMAVNPSMGLQYQKSSLENTKAQGDISKTKLEILGNATKQLRDMTASVRSDADMPRLKDAAAWYSEKFGLPLSPIPDRYDPQWQANAVMTGDEFLKQLETQRNRAVTMRGQDITNAREREQFAANAPTREAALKTADLTQQKLAEDVRVGRKTPGQEAMDKEFAKELATFKTGGGADAAKQIAQLNDVVVALQSGKNLTGPVIGRTPESVLSVTNPDSIAMRERVEEVVQRSLRSILGAQFTEKEGERLIARAYNKNLKEGENLIRVQRLIEQLKQAFQAKSEAADYFEQNGTLAGWTGKIPSISDFDAGGEAPNRPAQKPSGIRFLGFE